ncbi:estradiol 17-beta-dehydrogenase 11 precursor [Bipolaris maydis]|nr:estradiol 17-beta-dehydrogenase 11 precursor [Bipolaris maydis]KAJ6198163.1 estradiol 17-beta-dehydrogenase 11 precursor [Bipolaris maydis]
MDILNSIIGSFFGGSLAAAWLVNRWLSRRALNGGNAPSNYHWDKEIILITGGAGGISEEIVKYFQTRDTTVVVLDVLPLSYTPGKKTHYYKCDITSYDNLQVVATRIQEEVGEPTVAIANACICRGKPILEASKEAVEFCVFSFPSDKLTFGINNLAVLWTAKVFMLSMIKNNHGHFLVVASQTAYSSTPGLTDYSATKSAAVAIYEDLHSEVQYIHKARSVRVSCVSPGVVDTNIFVGIKLGLGISALTPQYVGTQIADIILAGRARNVFIPASAGFSVILCTMPDWFRAAMKPVSMGIFENLTPYDPMNSQRRRE